MRYILFILFQTKYWQHTRTAQQAQRAGAEKFGSEAASAAERAELGRGERAAQGEEQDAPPAVRRDEEHGGFGGQAAEGGQEAQVPVQLVF